MYRNNSSTFDLYSLGVTLYYMATKEYPFTSDCSLFYEMILSQTMWKIPKGIEIDDELHDLLRKLITFEEEERISWEQFFEHPFVKKAMK